MARGKPGGRERLVDASVALFGERGYQSTKVADIEERAGLSPRAGGFYRHFASKEEAFRAALERWIADVVAFPESVGALLPLDDRRAELTVVARGALDVLGRQRQLFRFLSREGAAFPDLVAEVHDRLVATGYAQMMAFLSARLRSTPVDDDRLRALAAIALGSLVHYREDEALYGGPPAEAKESAFVEAWVDLWLCWLEATPAPRAPGMSARTRPR